MNIHEAIELLDKRISSPSLGLPEEVFFFISRITPIVNVDLLIKDEKGRTLLSWRDDQYCGKGWHIPGGVVRFKERLETRIKKVVEEEIGTKVKFEKKPVEINEIILKPKIRGHFISFLYRCYLPSDFIPFNKGLNMTDAGYLMWHNVCPDNLIKCHERYRKYI
jgi:colanic acid biosynthesis protein WcaH